MMSKEVDELRCRISEAQLSLGLHAQDLCAMDLIKESKVKQKLLPWVTGHSNSEVENIFSPSEGCLVISFYCFLNGYLMNVCVLYNFVIVCSTLSLTDGIYRISYGFLQLFGNFIFDKILSKLSLIAYY
jgi:hypothetical protein